MYTDPGMYTDHTRRFLDRSDPMWRGLRFVSIGVFSVLMGAGYIKGWLWSLIWQPVPSVVIFIVTYSAFLFFLHWYRERKEDRVDASGERNRNVFWVSLGLFLAILLLAGALMGLTANTAGLVVAIWVFAYRAVYGRVWRVYTVYAVLLALSGVLPPTFGLPHPELLAVLFLGAGGGTFTIIGIFDHFYFLRWQRVRDIPLEEQ